MKRRRKGCIGCGGTRTVDAVDNFGNPYKGCPNCRLKSAKEIAAMCGIAAETEEEAMVMLGLKKARHGS